MASASNAHPACLNNLYCDTAIQGSLVSHFQCNKVVSHQWFGKPQAAHGFFLDSCGMPYWWFLAVVMFGFFLNLIRQQSQIAREYMMTESMCHVLLSVKLVVWIFSRYFVCSVDRPDCEC